MSTSHMWVVLADDDVLLREGLAGNGTQLLALAREAEPGLVVADIRMPPPIPLRGRRRPS